MGSPLTPEKKKTFDGIPTRNRSGRLLTWPMNQKQVNVIRLEVLQWLSNEALIICLSLVFCWRDCKEELKKFAFRFDLQNELSHRTWSWWKHRSWWDCALVKLRQRLFQNPLRCYTNVPSQKDDSLQLKLRRQRHLFYRLWSSMFPLEKRNAVAASNWTTIWDHSHPIRGILYPVFSVNSPIFDEQNADINNWTRTTNTLILANFFILKEKLHCKSGLLRVLRWHREKYS